MYKKGDFGQVARAFRVMDALRGFKRGRWVNEIADAIGASERTVRRDLAELADAGIGIEITKQSNRVFAQLTEERSYSPVAITKRERFTLLAVRRVFDVFRRTPFLDDVLSVLTKLEQRMSAERQLHVPINDNYISPSIDLSLWSRILFLGVVVVERSPLVFVGAVTGSVVVAGVIVVGSSLCARSECA